MHWALLLFFRVHGSSYREKCVFNKAGPYSHVSNENKDNLWFLTSLISKDNETKGTWNRNAKGPPPLLQYITLTHRFWIIISTHYIWTFAHSCTKLNFKNTCIFFFLFDGQFFFFICILTVAVLAFILFYLPYVCYAPKLQGKFLGYENLAYLAINLRPVLRSKIWDYRGNFRFNPGFCVSWRWVTCYRVTSPW